MLKRLVVGLVEGLLVGVVVSFALTRFALSWDSAVVAYGAAALAGAVTGLVAGKPIWEKDAKTEASLKAVISAFIAVTCMFGLRKWLPDFTTDLSAMRAGVGKVKDLPLVSLPLISMAIALVLEVDDAFGADPGAGASPRTRVHPNGASLGANGEQQEEDAHESRSARHER